MAFLYPWGNTQQLNLDWILQKIKELEAGSGGADLDEVATALIAASYAQQAYDRSDIVFRDGKLYRANQAIPAPGEAWTPAHWDEILLGDTVSNLVQYVAALSNDQIANSSNVSGTHTSDALNTLKNAIDNISLDSDSISNESQVTGDNVSDALDTLDGAISSEATTRGNADTALQNAVTDTNRALAIPITGDTNNTGNVIKANTFLAINSHSSLANGGYRAITDIANAETLSLSNLEYIPDGLANYLKYDRIVAASNTALITEIQNKFGNSGQVWAIMPFYSTGALFSDFPAGIGGYGAGFAVMCGYYHTVYYQSTTGDFYMGIKSYAAASWTWTQIH